MTTDKPDGRWLTIDEACEEVGVSRRTIYNWMNKGKLDTKYTAGGAPRIAAASLWTTKPEAPVE